MKFAGESIYFLAFDHRATFRRLVEQADGAIGTGLAGAQRLARVKNCKEIIYDAYLQAATAMPADTAARTAVIIDEEAASSLARDAVSRGVYTVMPAEKTEQKYFAFEYGSRWAEHIAAFSHQGVKGLVRWNPAEPVVNERQAAPLSELSAWLRANGRDLLLELLVQPTAAQLAECSGDYGLFDTAIRPGLTCVAMRELYEAGVYPDFWKIEGIADRQDCERVGEAALSRPDGQPAGCVVLGRSAPEAQVWAWMNASIGVPGYCGFALGRTLFNEPLSSWLRGTATRQSAVQTIADGYRRFVASYEAELQRA